MTTNIQGKVVAITGASSGIGEATARLLAQEGAKVVLGARRVDRLEALTAELKAKGGEVRFRALDVTKREDVEAFVDFTLKAFGRLDVLVNNAGVMPLSMLAELKVDEWDRMIDVNIRGVLHGIAAGLPVMQRQQSGQFINVSSTSGHSVAPSTAIYSATKFALRAITEGLRQEVGPNLRVTLISPGATESELAESISNPQMREAVKGYRMGAIPADAVARAISYAIAQPAEVDVSEIIVRPTAAKY